MRSKSVSAFGKHFPLESPLNVMMPSYIHWPCRLLACLLLSLSALTDAAGQAVSSYTVAYTYDAAGNLYVVCTREVLVLHDRDGDGRSEARTRLLHLDPYAKRGNPHGQMMGIAFSADGRAIGVEAKGPEVTHAQHV